MAKPRNWFRSLRGIVHTDMASPATTVLLPVMDDGIVVRILELAVRMGETMLVTGASASEVMSTIVRVAGAYGLNPVHVDVTYNAITASYHRSAQEKPITLLRVVRRAAPNHDKLQRLQALVTDIGEGLDLEEARTTYRLIRRSPFRYRTGVVVLAQASLAVGVSIMSGSPWLVLTLAFAAAALAALTQFALGRAQVPYFFSQIAGALVLTVVAALTPVLARTGWEAAADVRPSVIVASAVVLMLAGLTVVGAAQDAIDGFAVTATGRILELMTHTLGVVLGILCGLEVANVLGFGMEPPDDAVPLGPIPFQLVGAAIIAMAVAVMNGSGGRVIAVSAALSLVAWLGYLGASALGLEVAAASGIGAFVGSFIGVAAAYRLHVPAVAITTAAILPMVPGAAVFRGLLTVVEAGTDATALLTGSVTLIAAAIVGIALAVGASLGIYLGQPVRATLRSVTRSRARVRR